MSANFDREKETSVDVTQLIGVRARSPDKRPAGADNHVADVPGGLLDEEVLDLANSPSLRLYSVPKHVLESLREIRLLFLSVLVALIIGDE
jgi:hypothetical protein